MHTALTAKATLHQYTPHAPNKWHFLQHEGSGLENHQHLNCENNLL